MRAVIVAVLLPLAALASPLATRNNGGGTIAPLSADGESIDDSYIVVLKKDVGAQAMAMHLAAVDTWHGADPIYTFNSDGEMELGGINHVYMPQTSDLAYFGYAGKFSESTLNTIRTSPEVAYVERDQVVRTQEYTVGVDDAFSTTESIKNDDHIETELSAPWGLARISHRPKLRLSTFTKYLYDGHGGEGVTAYIIDTGINVQHVEFEGRAKWGKTIPKNDEDRDGNGHGTHCAGTIGSRKYGVAKDAHLVAVKVLGSNGSGSMSDVVAGVVWAAEDAAKNKAAAEKELVQTGKTKHKGSVANMSLGGGKAQSLDDAVNAAVESGLHFAVAAGNDNKDACDYSPARAGKAVTVGASTLGDERAYFSNHGKCVDIFAPGLNILSTWNAGNQSTNTISGTSMASPHICGLLAYLLSIEGHDTFNMLSGSSVEMSAAEPSIYAKALSLLPGWAKTVLPEPTVELVKGDSGESITPAKLKKALIGLASSGMLSDLPTGTPNLLAFNNATRESTK